MENTHDRRFFFGGALFSVGAVGLCTGLTVFFRHPASITFLVLSCLLLIYFRIPTFMICMDMIIKHAKSRRNESEDAPLSMQLEVIVHTQLKELPGWRINQIMTSLPYIDSRFLWSSTLLDEVRNICDKPDMCHANPILETLAIATPDINVILEGHDSTQTPSPRPAFQLFQCRSSEVLKTLRQSSNNNEKVIHRRSESEESDLSLCHKCHKLWKLLALTGINRNSPIIQHVMNEFDIDEFFGKGPMRLMDLCRITIRKELRHNVFYATSRLPLPLALQEFLRFDSNPERFDLNSAKFFYMLDKKIGDILLQLKRPNNK